MSIKIALIEDNTDMRENIREILELADYAVFTAENGKRGVEIIKSELPDLILCDIMMPELDGYGVLHIISNNPKTAKIPFIFLTAKTERDDFRKGMNMGADDYLTKPFDDTQLLDAIERRLKRIELFSNEFPPNEAGLTDFFNNVSGLKELEQLKESRHTKKYNKKDSIYSESYYPSFLYFINSGKVRTSKMNMDGKDFVTGLFKEGEFFGFYNMLGKFAAVIGPVLMGYVTLLTGSVRIGILSILILFIIGAFLLSKVDFDAGEKIAIDFGKK